MFRWLPFQRIEFRSEGASCGPATRIDRGCMAKVHARKRTKVCNNAVLPPKGVDEEAIRAPRCCGIVYRRIRPAHNDSRIINELSQSGAINLPNSSGATQRRNVYEFVSSMLRGQWNLGR